MLRRVAVVVGTLALLAFGLDRLPAAPVPTHLMPKETPFAFPTVVGTTWVYEVGGADVTIAVSAVEDKDGTKLVTTERVVAGGKNTHHWTYAVSAKGLFLAAEDGGSYDEPWCILKLPHREGDEWETKPARKGAVLITGTMTSGPAEKVKLPAGEFTAVRVDWRTGGNVESYWYAQGVGLVRQGGSTKWNLKSFTPRKE